VAGVRPGSAGPNESVIETTLHETVSASAEGVPGGCRRPGSPGAATSRGDSPLRTGGTIRVPPRSIRRLNQPEQTAVEVRDGLPGAVRFRGSWRPVARVEDAWRIDDGWWRASPVARTYFRLDVGNGLVLTVYRDDEKGTWWTQRY
jgi:hypothetical protein